jgi:hypothetical protein
MAAILIYKLYGEAMLESLFWMMLDVLMAAILYIAHTQKCIINSLIRE